MIFIIFFASAAYAELELDSAYPTLGALGKNLEVTVKGGGFDSNTTVSMYLDSGNKRAIIGSVDTPDIAYGVTVVGTVAYIADAKSGLQVIDVSNPASPKIIGSVDTPGTAFDVTLVDNMAYVASGSCGLQVVDLSNPASPQIIGAVDTPDIARDVTVVDNTAYVADGFYGSLQVIDVSKPTNPHVIGAIDTQGVAHDVTVIGNKAYVADANGRLIIVAVPLEIEPVTLNNEARISFTIPSPILAAHYTLRVFNSTESEELLGAVSFAGDLQIFNSKAIIVAGGGQDAPGEIWEETKKSANKAYDILVYEGSN